jgi:hypothetical protein
MLEGLEPAWLAFLQIALGLVFCFVGHSAARVVLAVWGALVGFIAGMLAYFALLSWPQAAFLAQVPWWAVAIGTAVLVAWLSFAFYTVAVLVSMGAAGWALGQFAAGLVSPPPWIAFSLSLLLAAGLVMVGWTLNLPKALLVLLTAAVGAGATISGIQLLLNQRVNWFDQLAWKTDLLTQSVWTGAYLALAIAGMVVQFRQKSEDTLREAYKRA